MDELQELREKAKRISDEIAELQSELRDVGYKIATMQTPFKIGDRVYVDGGKPDIFEISKIGLDYGTESNFTGRKIKKNGDPGLIESRIWIWGNQSLKLAPQP